MGRVGETVGRWWSVVASGGVQRKWPTDCVLTDQWSPEGGKSVQGIGGEAI